MSGRLQLRRAPLEAFLLLGELELAASQGLPMAEFLEFGGIGAFFCIGFAKQILGGIADSIDH